MFAGLLIKLLWQELFLPLIIGYDDGDDVVVVVVFVVYNVVDNVDAGDDDDDNGSYGHSYFCHRS